MSGEFGGVGGGGDVLVGVFVLVGVCEGCDLGEEGSSLIASDANKASANSGSSVCIASAIRSCRIFSLATASASAAAWASAARRRASARSFSRFSSRARSASISSSRIFFLSSLTLRSSSNSECICSNVLGPRYSTSSDGPRQNGQPSGVDGVFLIVM